MNTYIVTLVSRAEVPVLATTEEEAIAKAQAVLVYADASTTLYNFDEYDDEAVVTPIENDSTENDEAVKNEQIYQENCI